MMYLVTLAIVIDVLDLVVKGYGTMMRVGRECRGTRSKDSLKVVLDKIVGVVGPITETAQGC
jgi:hypothetical protein